jgi:hypothetical protein
MALLKGGLEIRLVPLQGGQPRTFTIKGYPYVIFLMWAGDSKSILARTTGKSGTEIIRIDLNGNVQPIQAPPDPVGTLDFAIPSPDGRHLAIRAQVTDANVWMIDNI